MGCVAILFFERVRAKRDLEFFFLNPLSVSTIIPASRWQFSAFFFWYVTPSEQSAAYIEQKRNEPSVWLMGMGPSILCLRMIFVCPCIFSFPWRSLHKTPGPMSTQASPWCIVRQQILHPTSFVRTFSNWKRPIVCTTNIIDDASNSWRGNTIMGIPRDFICNFLGHFGLHTARQTLQSRAHVCTTLMSFFWSCLCVDRQPLLLTRSMAIGQQFLFFFVCCVRFGWYSWLCFPLFALVSYFGLQKRNARKMRIFICWVCLLFLLRRFFLLFFFFLVRLRLANATLRITHHCTWRLDISAVYFRIFRIIELLQFERCVGSANSLWFFYKDTACSLCCCCCWLWVEL